MGEQESRSRDFQVPRLFKSISQTVERDARAPIVGRVALSLFAIWVDSRIVPALYSARPFLALGAFATLVIVSDKSRQEGSLLPRISAIRLAVFASLHVLLVLAANHFTAELNSVAHSYSAAASIISASRVLVVLPTLVLFPLSRRFYEYFAAELIAAVIVLFMFFPNRYFEWAWPWYSRVLTMGASFVCSAFVPGTHVVDGPGGLAVVGPSVDMVVDFSCSGITGMNLFHLLFGVVVAIEWNRLHKRRALICFVIGGLAYVVANFLRLVLLFLIGNLLSSKINLDFLGWVLFGITFSSL
jgi:exosortase/archaeosortase family protein